MVFGNVAGVEMGLGDPVIVPLQKAPEDLGQVLAGHRVEPADDAEVHGGDLGRGGDEEVALVQIGVEDAMVHGLGQEGADQVVGQGRPVQAGQGQGRRIRERHPRRPFQHQGAPTHGVPDHLGRAHIGVGGHDLGHLAGAGGLQAQIQLQAQGPGDGLGHGRRLQAPGGGDIALDQPGGEAQDLYVLGDPPLDPWPQHLHRDLAAIDEGRGMGLGQGGRADRLAEIGEDLIEGLVEGGGDDGAGLVGGEGRQLILQPRQIVRERPAEHVRPGGEHLTELDGHGAETFQGPRQPLPRPTPPRLRAGEGPQGRRGEPDARRQDRVELAGDQGVGAHQHPARAEEASKGGDIAHRARVTQPWCRAATPPVKLVQVTRSKPASRIIWAKVTWSGNRRMLSTRYW